MSDEQWLKERLAGVVPSPPQGADRIVGVTARRRRRQRVVAAGAAAVICVVVVGATLTGRALMAEDTTSGPATTGPTDSGSPTPEPSAPVIDCPKDLYAVEPGMGQLAPGVVAARLCSSGSLDSEAPGDTLTTGLDALVGTINRAEPGSPGCLGGIGGDYVLLLAYPDGSLRRVALQLACDYLYLGSRLLSASETYTKYVRLIREQRASSTPPADVPEPACVNDRVYSAFADPDEMVAARLCVAYNEDGAGITSVAVASDDLETILDGWRSGATAPIVKGPGCGPTVPTWILSGVTAWGDRVTIEAECDRPSRGDDWVTLNRAAREVVNRLIAEAGIDVPDGNNAETAWLLAKAWIGAVNARAIVSNPAAAAEIGRIANGMWVADAWLPDGELDWNLLAASRIDVPGWNEAWRVPARTPTGEAVFTIVRDDKDAPWRILSLVR